MSRADKTQTRITYDLYLDEENERLERLVVTVLCAMRGDDSVAPQRSPGALSSERHVAFTFDYRFRDRDAVDRFPVPRDAARLLR